ATVLTIFPYTSLFRSQDVVVQDQAKQAVEAAQEPAEIVIAKELATNAKSAKAGEKPAAELPHAPTQEKAAPTPVDAAKSVASEVDRKSTRLNSSHVKN